MARTDTKTHIIETALQLFNENGYGATTTAALAEATGKTEGNIWYHFKNKRALFDAIAYEFVKRSFERTNLRPTYGGNIMLEYAKMLHVFSDELRDFRFMYRDQVDFGEHSDLLTSKIQELYDNTFAQFELYFDVMVDKGILADKPDQVQALMKASIIVIRYHLEIWRERGMENRSGSGAVQEAFELHVKLFEPLMTAEAVKTLRMAISDYDAALAH